MNCELKFCGLLTGFEVTVGRLAQSSQYPVEGQQCTRGWGHSELIISSPKSVVGYPSCSASAQRFASCCTNRVSGMPGGFILSISWTLLGSFRDFDTVDEVSSCRCRVSR